MNLPNDTKILFCNAVDAIGRHDIGCSACREYMRFGDGDLCEEGKQIIAREMAYADTRLELRETR